MSLRHLVLITLHPGTDTDRREELVAGLRRLPTVIDGVASYEVGEDLGITPGAPDLSVVASFDTLDDFQAYRAHPEHLDLVERLLEPISTRVSTQFHL